jgi:N-acetylneuraminate lyase
MPDNNHLEGLIAAVHTPMHGDGSINFDLVEAQYRMLKDNHISCAFLNGSTGEGLSLTTKERLELAEAWKDVVDDPFNLIVHVGHNSYKECQILARHAENDIKARAIAVVGPGYFKPATIDDLVDYCAEITSVAPNTPFYYYHIPSFNGVYFPMLEFIKVASKRIPTFVGLKYTHEDMMDYCECLAYAGGKYDILYGRDEILLSALVIGAKGAIGSTYNFAAPLFQKIIKAFKAGDLIEAQKNHKKAIQMVAVLKKYPIMAALKAAMKAIGLDCGPCRLPLKSLSDEEYNRFVKDLEQIGFFSYCSHI